MNSLIAKTRMSEVIRTDSITASNADFMATHVPFSNISIKIDKKTGANECKKSEEEIYNLLFCESGVENKHQFIVVAGSSGAGKSHFIRWLNAKLDSVENSSDIVVFITRSDNTLRGTIKQLLNIKEVKNISNHDIYERLVKANQTISEQKLKATIYRSFITEIECDESENMSNHGRANLKILFSNSLFQEKMLKAGAPIDRLFNKINSNGSVADQDIVTAFQASDLIIDEDFAEKMRNDGADRKAIRTAEKLIPKGSDFSEASKTAQYLNTLVDTVIQECIGIEAGDFEQIFKEIRQELKSQGKNLILLIEDITAFTGVNQDLLNALITEHTGLNEKDNLCRLISVIGTTTGYYSEFRDNYRDRVTTEININDGTIGSQNKSELIQFVAKYLNTMSLPNDTVETWYKNGAADSDYPVHTVSEGADWDFYRYKIANGSEFNLSLYPFTKNAIINLYDKMEAHKTPRYILRDIVEKAVNDIIYNKENFPSFCEKSAISLKDNTIIRIDNIINGMSKPDEEKKLCKERVKNLIAFWGDTTLESKGKKISGISLKIFEEINLSDFATKVFIPNSDIMDIIESPTDEIEVFESKKEVTEPAMSDEQKKRQELFNKHREYVMQWHDGGEKAYLQTVEKTGSNIVRDAICSFIYSTIDWQIEGVSEETMNLVKNAGNKTIITIIRQVRGSEKGLVILPDDDDTFKLLLAFGKWAYLGNKSWAYTDSADDIYFVTRWLSMYKNKFVAAVKGYCENDVPIYIKCAVICDIYRKIINGNYCKDRLSDINILCALEDKSQLRGHSEKWNDLISWIYNGDENGTKAATIHTQVLEYFKLLQGGQSSEKKYLLNHTLYNKTLKEIKSVNFKVNNLSEIAKDEIAKKNEPIIFLRKLLLKFDTAVKDEIAKANNLRDKLTEYLGFEKTDTIEQQDIEELIRDTEDFIGQTLTNNIPINTKKVSFRVSDIIAALDKIDAAIICEDNVRLMQLFSSNPLGRVELLIDYLSSISLDIDRVTANMTAEKSKLEASGLWTDKGDTRFEEKSNEFTSLYKEFMEAIK